MAISEHCEDWSHGFCWDPYCTCECHEEEDE